MTPETFNRIRAENGLSIADMARLLRIRDRSTIHRWATGHTPVSGPASLVLELLDQGYVTLGQLMDDFSQNRC